MIDLAMTANLMNSRDYTNRFEAEYIQAKIRHEKLRKMLTKYEAETLDFTPTCPFWMLERQEKAMGEYVHILEVRAEKEGIHLPSVCLEYPDTSEAQG